MQDIGSLLLPLALVGLLWFMLIRPARKQQQAVAAIQRAIDVGDKVQLSSGIFGTIASMDDDRVRLEIAPGVQIEVARQAVVRKAPDAPAVDAPAADEE